MSSPWVRAVPKKELRPFVREQAVGKALKEKDKDLVCDIAFGPRENNKTSSATRTDATNGWAERVSDPFIGDRGDIRRRAVALQPKIPVSAGVKRGPVSQQSLGCLPWEGARNLPFLIQRIAAFGPSDGGTWTKALNRAQMIAHSFTARDAITLLNALHDYEQATLGARKWAGSFGCGEFLKKFLDHHFVSLVEKEFLQPAEGEECLLDEKTPQTMS